MKKKIQNVYRQMKPKIHWFIHNEGISLILSCFVLIFAFYLFSKTNREELNPFDYSVFITVILAISLNFLSVILGKFIANRFEDDLKLTSNYESLAKKYTYEGLYIENSIANGVDAKNMKILHKAKKAIDKETVKIKLPIIVDEYLYGKNIKIIDDQYDKYDVFCKQ